MAIAHLNGIDMHYQVRGDGPPVVLAHGVGGNTFGWWQQVNAFSERYKVVMFDHRSFGLSTDDGRGASAFVDDLEALLDFLAIDEVALVGQSMGSFTCVGFTNRHPERVQALAISGSLAGLAPATNVVAGSLVTAEDWERFVRTQVARGGFPTRSPDLFVLYDLMCTLNLRASPRTLETVLETRYDVESLAAANIPTLLLNGDEETTVGAAMSKVAAQLPRARHITIPDAGHLAYFEKAAEYNRHVLEFLAENIEPN